jgi:hypothetical protein
MHGLHLNVLSLIPERLRERYMDINCVFQCCGEFLFLTSFAPLSIWRSMSRNTRRSSCKMSPFCLLDFNKIWNVWIYFNETSEQKISSNEFSIPRVHSRIRTDGRSREVYSRFAGLHPCLEAQLLSHRKDVPSPLQRKID